MRIAFFWMGLDGRYGQWNDGLRAALKLIEKEHEVRYYDVTPETLEEVRVFGPDIVLFWEAPCTQFSKEPEASMFKGVASLPYKKCLLFAGGPLKAMDVKDFDLVFVESKVNEEDCERQGIPYRKAFGTNTEVFHPVLEPLIYDAFLQATFAEWKRHSLFADAVGMSGAVSGRKQEFDTNGYYRCEAKGVYIYDELPAEGVARMINKSYCVLNTSNEQGGGQRATLEAMACGCPVIVMADSPKNREYVEESGGGVVCEPTPQAIQTAIDIVKSDKDMGLRGLEYIHNKYTEWHYAKALLNGIYSIL